MALIMAYTDPCGRQNPQAYWTLAAGVQIFGHERRIVVTFQGWASRKDYEAGAEPLPGAVKRYEVTGGAFNALYAEFAKAIEATYKHALTIPESGTGKSFFDGAREDKDK